MRLSITIICLVLFFYESFCQNKDTTQESQPQNVLQSVNNISSKSLKYINEKYNKLTNAIEVQSEKVLKRMQQKEEKLQKKLQRLDSTKAEALFGQTRIKYEELQAKLKAPIDKAIANPLKEYIPGVDSLQTIMKFLSQPGITFPGIRGEELEQIQSMTNQVQQLQERLQQANEIQNFIRSRESQLKSVLANTVFGKELLGINKEAYYYQERLAGYKQLLNDRKKLEEKVFSAVRNLPAFQKFWRKNSYLDQLFPMPNNYGTSQALAGLQTRVNTQNVLTQRIRSGGASGTAPQQYVQQQLQQAQSELNKLKNKINKFSSGNSDMTAPDFKPNSQKTKSFLQRLEYSFNIQSQRSTSYLPSMSDFGLSVGYKISDNKTLGIGASYKLGLGSGWNHVRLTNQGVGIKSYADIKAKGSFWVTGGMEYNYLSEFKTLDQIKNLDAWQKSALIGITKKIKIGKKQTNIQLLYDFLSAQQVPKPPALKFRIGWTL